MADSRGYILIMNGSDIPASAETAQNVVEEVIVASETAAEASTNFYIYIIAAVVLLIVFFVMRKGSSKTSKREICLVGERCSGKTQLFISLSQGKPF